MIEEGQLTLAPPHVGADEWPHRLYVVMATATPSPTCHLPSALPANCVCRPGAAQWREPWISATTVSDVPSVSRSRCIRAAGAREPGSQEPSVLETLGALTHRCTTRRATITEDGERRTPLHAAFGCRMEDTRAPGACPATREQWRHRHPPPPAPPPHP